jgi:hypothetical protein
MVIWEGELAPIEDIKTHTISSSEYMNRKHVSINILDDIKVEFKELET